MEMGGQMNIINEVSMLEGLTREINYANSIIAAVAILPTLFCGIILLSSSLPENEGWGVLASFIILAVMSNAYIGLVVRPWKEGKKVGLRFIAFILIQVMMVVLLMLFL